LKESAKKEFLDESCFNREPEEAERNVSKQLHSGKFAFAKWSRDAT